MTRRKRTVQWTVMITLLAMSAGARVHARIPEKSEEQEAKVARVISGTVLDPSGASVAGAKVVLATAGGETISATTTDTSGGFRFEKAGQGNYQIRVQAAGFQDFKTEINMDAKAPAPVQITLTIQEQNEVVTIGTTDFSPQVTADVSENQNANMLDRSTLDRVPVFDQDYITTMSRFLDDSAAGTNGVTLIVNGIEANGPGVTPSAVQEVKINQNPYSARFARPGRARLEITMKGGTPSYHGSVNFMFRDSVFDVRNAFAQVKPGEQRRYFEGSLTGSLGHSKHTSFLLSLDEDQQGQQAFVVAEVQPNVQLNENVANPTRRFFGSGRVFHDLVNGDQFWMGYSYEPRTVQNQGVGGTVLPS